MENIKLTKKQKMNKNKINREMIIVKNRLNNVLKEAELLMKGKIKALRFYKVDYNEDCWLNDERVLDATNYLDGKGIFYTLKDIEDEKHGEGLELKLINDAEEIDCIYEELNCAIVFSGFNKDEERFLDKLDKMNVNTFHYFMTKEQIENTRWELIKYIVGDKFNFDVFYSEGLVVISR